MVFFARDKVLTVFFAANTELCYPTIHSLAFYLSKKGVVFEGYHFALSSHSPYGDMRKAFAFPQSIDLTKDLNFLVGVSLLSEKTSLVIKYALGPRSAEIRQSNIDTFNSLGEMSFADLQREVRSALSNPRSLYELSYRHYIELPSL